MSMEEILWECPCGYIKGIKEESAAVFKGIAYGNTPRFQEPKLIDTWRNVFDGTKGEVDCYQYSSFVDESEGFYAKEFRSDKKTYYNETPMTLNIVAPLNHREKKPVLVFFHGGGFETGTVGELPYGTSREYVKENVVFVSAGYRLNIFGLYGGENYMLMDQLCAIQWVRNNISGFGGDPENITIMGQSAGAMCVMDLLCSGELEGKIKGAIMMSGAGIAPKFSWPDTKEGSKQLWDDAAASIEGDIFEARANEVWKAWQSARSRETLLPKLKHTQPSIDGRVLKEFPGETVKKGKILNVPMIVGVTSQDMLPPFLYHMAMKLGLDCQKMGHAPVYGYFFDRVLPGNSYKAFHASDLWYMFGNLEKSWRPFEEVDYALCETMVHNVATFCRDGKPSDEEWLPISKENKGFRHFDGVDKGLVDPKFCKKKLWNSMLKDRGPM